MFKLQSLFQCVVDPLFVNNPTRIDKKEEV